MLINNKKIVQDRNSALYEKLKNFDNECVDIVTAKSGDQTLVLNSNGQIYSCHSRYNPKKEVQDFLEKYINRDLDYILVIGVGLGYIVDELINKFPNTTISIYEPNLSIMEAFLSNFDLSNIKSRNLDEIFTSKDELADLNSLLQILSNKKSEILISPFSNHIYINEIDELNNAIRQYLISHKNSMITDLIYQTRWTINSIINLNEVLKSPNLFEHCNLEKFKNKPVLIVAAGPALDYEIENIRLIKNSKKAYIFAVGSAVNTLISYDILPDALFSYDPQEFNANVTKKIKDLNLQIPLVFGSSVGFETLVDYPYKKVHFFTSQDSISPNLVDPKKLVIIPDAPTITTITLYITGLLNMGPIILVGQNLAVTKEKAYAEGIEYYIEDNENISDSLKNYQVATSTLGNEIYTNNDYLEMKYSIEYTIKMFDLKDRVYNTTQDGLPIGGAPFKSLADLIAEMLQQNDVVLENLFDSNEMYDLDIALKNYISLEKDFNDMISHFKKLVEIDTKIQNDYNKKIIGNVGHLFNQFDIHFEGLEKNKFFLLVIAPSTRVQYKELIEQSKRIPLEKRPLAKMKLYIEIYSKYIRTIYVSIYEIQSAFKVLKDSEFGEKLNSIK